MERSWCSTEAHLKSNDEVCTVSCPSQESAQSQTATKNKIKWKEGRKREGGGEEGKEGTL